MTTKHLLYDGIVALRALEPTDIDQILKWENDPEIWTVSNTQAPYSRQMVWEYLENYTGDIYASRQLRLVMTLASQPDTSIGTVDFLNFNPFHNRAELGMLIDSDYRGEIVCALVNMSTEPYTVEPFERIGQLIFLAHYSVAFEEVERLPQTSRGADGFGSSGRF